MYVTVTGTWIELEKIKTCRLDGVERGFISRTLVGNHSCCWGQHDSMTGVDRHVFNPLVFPCCFSLSFYSCSSFVEVALP